MARAPAKPQAKKKPPPARCKERKRNGDPCGNAPMRGRDICSSHARITARSTLLDPETVEALVNGLISGVGIGVAATHAGISRRTAHGWLDRGEKEHHAGITAEDSEFVALLHRVLRARASVQVQLAAQIRSSARTGNGDWRAAAWMLERLAPADFGAHKVSHPPHEHDEEQSVSAELLDGRQPVDIPLEKREQIIALLEEGSGGEVVDAEVVP